MQKAHQYLFCKVLDKPIKRCMIIGKKEGVEMLKVDDRGVTVVLPNHSENFFDELLISCRSRRRQAIMKVATIMRFEPVSEQPPESFYRRKSSATQHGPEVYL